MKRRLLILALATTGCTGGGESTTAAATAAESSSGNPAETESPEDTGMPMTGSSGTPMTGSTGDTDATGDTMSADDTTTVAETSGTTGGCADVELLGQWLSEGDNVAPLLVNVLDLVSVHAIFAELTFDVTSTNGDGAMGQQTGTYSVELCPGSDTKYSITLDQTVPSAITVEGIFEIDGCVDPAVMRYEVIQTQPDLGAVAPTCDDDFGAGAFGADNIQVFERQP